MSKQHPSILKVDAPISSADVKFLLNQMRESAKGTVSPKIGENIEMLICFICMGTQDRTLIDTNHHYQITMNQHKN